MKPETMKNESHVKTAVKALLKQVGAWYFMPVPAGYGRVGVPDFIVCLNGHFMGIETKFENRPTTVNQEREMQAIQRAGGTCLVVNQWSLDALETALRARPTAGEALEETKR